ncbi:IclR family transcriptional regulator [Oceanobacillus arenosus]|uniref:IclR family transcriptional regulator n=1 Tax=Oceanobacillus arenosus TaxID=1229153 RepID=UPI001FE9C19D|nr:IclR family transcriptional regulator [Oceanobacillus arenosus]
MKLFELGSVLSKQLDIREIAHRHIQKLVNKLNRTVHLAIYDHGKAIYVEKIEVPHTIQISSQVGKLAPMYCTGVGKSILAYLDDEKIELILTKNEFKKFTENTLVDKEEIKQELKQIRKQLYCMDNEEIELDLKCIAAPIFNHKGEVIAGISCSAPKMRITDEKLPMMIDNDNVRKCALHISEALGLNVEALKKYTSKEIYRMYITTPAD